jgi:ADP-ribose pyrophosphatase YjhB (NUDIX family)
VRDEIRDTRGATMFGEIFGVLQRTVHWLSSRPNRLRIRGARIEVIAAVVTRKPTQSILLARAGAGGGSIWTLPQEGVGLQETFEQALYRCLQVECGLELPEKREQVERNLYVRVIRYAGMLDLPEARRGERDVADDVIGTPLESVKLKRKAYWVGTILVETQDKHDFKPDGIEILELRWCGIEEATEQVKASNRPEKAALLIEAIRGAAKHL